MGLLWPQCSLVVDVKMTRVRQNTGCATAKARVSRAGWSEGGGIRPVREQDGGAGRRYVPLIA